MTNSNCCNAATAQEATGRTEEETVKMWVEFIEARAKTLVRQTHAKPPAEYITFVTASLPAAFDKLDAFLCEEAKAA